MGMINRTQNLTTNYVTLLAERGTLCDSLSPIIFAMRQLAESAAVVAGPKETSLLLIQEVGCWFESNLLAILKCLRFSKKALGFSNQNFEAKISFYGNNYQKLRKNLRFIKMAGKHSKLV